MLGGVAARHDVTLDVLDDLHVALDTLLEHEEGERDLTVVLRLAAGNVEVSVGPFEPGVVAELDEEVGEELSLRRLLDAVVDVVTVGERDDGCWVELRKGYALASEAALMPRESDRILLRRYHEQGDLGAREQLIEQYLSLVRSLARRYSYRGEQLDDLVQIGCIGLIKAIDRFDLDRGVELTTYATPNIIGEIKRHFRDKGWAVRVPRGLQELNVQLSQLIEELTVQLGRSPTIPELAKAAGVEEEEVLEALESGRAYPRSRSPPGRRRRGRRARSARVARHRGAPVRVSEDRAVLAPGFRVLDERERRILHLRFFDGLTQSQIARRSGSRRCTSRA